MAELTDEAKALIADSIRIVREDRFEKYARERIGKHTEPKDPPKPEPTPEPKPEPTPGPTPPTPTPPAPTPTPPTPEVPEGAPPGGPERKKSLWWGDLGED